MFLALLALGLAGLGSLPALADDDGGKNDGGHKGGGKGGGQDDNDSGDSEKDDGDHESSSKDDDDDKIRSAVRKGEAEPLRKILALVRERYDGNIVHIGLTGKGSNLQYQIRLINLENKLIEISVNAKTATIVGTPSLY